MADEEHSGDQTPELLIHHCGFEFSLNAFVQVGKVFPVWPVKYVRNAGLLSGWIPSWVSANLLGVVGFQTRHRTAA